MNAAEAILGFVNLWGIAGAAVAVLFLFWGIDRIDEDADGAYVFRPLLIPGILLIWPLVLWRWWVLAAGRDQWERRHAPPRDAHRTIAVLLALIVAATLLTALALKQTWPADVAPEQLSGAAEAAQ